MSENVLISALIAFCTFAKVEVNQGMNPSKVTNDFDIDLDIIDRSNGDAIREMLNLKGVILGYLWFERFKIQT